MTAYRDGAASTSTISAACSTVSGSRTSRSVVSGVIAPLAGLRCRVAHRSGVLAGEGVGADFGVVGVREVVQAEDAVHPVAQAHLVLALVDRLLGECEPEGGHGGDLL